MFSYYGSKSKIARYYPKPEYNIIVEPFAGAAWYSVNNIDRHCILNDKYNTVHGIWEWLIKECTKEELSEYRDFYIGEDISNLDIRKEHKDLIGFCINRGSSSPCNIVQKWSCQSKLNPNYASTLRFQIDRIIKNLDYISLWENYNLDYWELENIEATWFIDPPYQKGGERYKENYIDYDFLSEWCLSRKGQIIVCENKGADWLDFRDFREITGQRSKTTEVIYTNY